MALRRARLPYYSPLSFSRPAFTLENQAGYTCMRGGNAAISFLPHCFGQLITSINVSPGCPAPWPHAAKTTFICPSVSPFLPSLASRLPWETAGGYFPMPSGSNRLLPLSYYYFHGFSSVPTRSDKRKVGRCLARHVSFRGHIDLRRGGREGRRREGNS